MGTKSSIVQGSGVCGISTPAKAALRIFVAAQAADSAGNAETGRCSQA